MAARRPAGEMCPTPTTIRTEGTMKKFLEYGGIAASIILIVFGIGATIVGIDGRDRVRTELAQSRSSAPSTPASPTSSSTPAARRRPSPRSCAITPSRPPAARPTRRCRASRRRRQGHERREGRRQGPQERRAGRQPGAQYLGDRNRAHDRAEHRVLRREHGHIRDRHGDRPASDRDRLPGPHTAGAPSARCGQEVPPAARSGCRGPALT